MKLINKEKRLINPCHYCNGEGQILKMEPQGFILVNVYHTCYHCGGTGEDESRI